MSTGETEWKPPVWENYTKHLPVTNGTSWADVIATTQAGFAKYHNDLTRPQIEALEMRIFRNGEDLNQHFVVQSKTVRFYYLDAGRIIGASRGEETTFIKIQWSQAGGVHGQPISVGELESYLRKKNPDQFQQYKQRNHS